MSSDTPKNCCPCGYREADERHACPITYNKLEAALTTKTAELEACRVELEACRRDTQRLDAIQSLTRGYGKGWILRDSSTERGMRLHETSMGGASPNVRLAIDSYVEATKGGEPHG